MRAGFDRIDAKFDGLHRVTIQFAATMFAAFVALFAAQIGVILAVA